MDKLSLITYILARAYTDKKTSEVPAVIQYKGVTTTELTDGASTNPITINGQSYTAENGDVVFYNGTAFAYDGSVWQATMSLAQIITALEAVQAEIGTMANLTTTDKSSLVAAINELVTDLGGKVDKVAGKGLSTNDYDDTAKAAVDALGTASTKNAPASGNAGQTEVVLGNDTRLTDARTPVAHTHTLSDVTDAGTAAAKNVPATGNASTSEVVLGNDTRLTDARTPVSHTHTLAYITDANTKQDATDNNLATTSKQVVGAINEVNSNFTSLGLSVVNGKLCQTYSA